MIRVAGGEDYRPYDAARATLGGRVYAAYRTLLEDVREKGRSSSGRALR